MRYSARQKRPPNVAVVQSSALRHWLTPRLRDRDAEHPIAVVVELVYAEETPANRPE